MDRRLKPPDPRPRAVGKFSAMIHTVGRSYLAVARACLRGLSGQLRAAHRQALSATGVRPPPGRTQIGPMEAPISPICHTGHNHKIAERL